MINPYLKEDREYPLITIKRQAEQLKAEGHDVIDLTIGDPQDRTFDGAVQTIQHFMAENSVSQYPLATGSARYLEAVSNWAKRNYQIKLEPIKHIFSSNGSKEAIFLFALTFDWSDRTGEIWSTKPPPELLTPQFENCQSIECLDFFQIWMSLLIANGKGAASSGSTLRITQPR